MAPRAVWAVRKSIACARVHRAPRVLHRAIEVAQSLGADPAKIEKDLESAEIKKLLGGTMRAADQLRIGGTPAFVVADGVIVGAVGQDALTDTIKAARTCGKSVC